MTYYNVGFLSIILFVFTSFKAPPLADYSKYPPCGKRMVESHEFHYPCPNKNLLFYLQRNKNENTILYEINRGSNGKINADDPIHIYWIKWAFKGDSIDLNWIERTVAFGVDIKHKDPINNKYNISHVSSDKVNFTVTIDDSGQAIALTTIANKKAYLNSIYVEATEYLLKWPTPRYLILYGTEIASGNKVQEKISLE